MGQDTLREVRDGAGHTPEVLKWVGTPYGRSWTRRDTLRKTRDGSGHPPGGTSGDILQEVRDGSRPLREVRD